MRKIVYVCDRCGCEIDGNAGNISISTYDNHGVRATADPGELASLLPDESGNVLDALGWDLCAECIASILRTLIKADRPRIKRNLPDAEPPKEVRPKKATDRKLDQMEDRRNDRK